MTRGMLRQELKQLPTKMLLNGVVWSGKPPQEVATPTTTPEQGRGPEIMPNGEPNGELNYPCADSPLYQTPIVFILVGIILGYVMGLDLCKKQIVYECEFGEILLLSPIPTQNPIIIFGTVFVLVAFGNLMFTGYCCDVIDNGHNILNLVEIKRERDANIPLIDIKIKLALFISNAINFKYDFGFGDKGKRK